jgi:hypothetical protein
MAGSLRRAQPNETRYIPEASGCADGSRNRLPSRRPIRRLEPAVSAAEA